MPHRTKEVQINKKESEKKGFKVVAINVNSKYSALNCHEKLNQSNYSSN